MIGENGVLDARRNLPAAVGQDPVQTEIALVIAASSSSGCLNVHRVRRDPSTSADGCVQRERREPPDGRVAKSTRLLDIIGLLMDA